MRTSNLAMASRAMIRGLNHHLVRSKPWLARLQASGRGDPFVLALLLTETFFRRPTDRAAEYLAWLGLGLLWPGRARRLSVGVAQLQVRHWKRLQQWESNRLTPARLAETLRVAANYDACERFLYESAGAAPMSTQRVAAIYRGEARSYHVSVLQRAVTFALGARNVV